MPRPRLLAACAALAAFLSPALPRVFAAAEAGRPFVRVFTRDDLGASPVNWRVCAHPGGRVCVANNLAVLEYDGVTWRRIRTASRPSDTLAIDDAGQLWGSHLNQIFTVQRLPDGTREWKPEEGRIAEPDRAFGQLSQSVATPEGVYFLGAKHLFRVRRTGAIPAWHAETAFTTMWAAGGVLHVVQRDRGLFRLRAEKLEPVAGAPRAWPVVFAAHTDSAAPGRQLLLTARGPMQWDESGGLAPLAALDRTWFEQHPALDALRLPDGRLAFADPRRGLLVFAADGQFLFRIDRASGLPTDRINGLALDREGGLWLATANGIARVAIGLPVRQHTAQQSYGGSVRSVARHEGTLYLAHAEGVSALDHATGRFRALTGLPENTNGGVTMASAGGHLIVAASGLRELNASGELVLQIPTDYNTLLASSREPGLVFGSALRGGLDLLVREDGRWRAREKLADFPHSTVRMIDTGDGFVWGTTTKGPIWRADFRRGIRGDAPVRLYREADGVPPGYRSDFGQLFRLGDTIVAGWDRAVVRYDAATDRFVPETRIAGLPADKGVNLAATASDGRLWLNVHIDTEPHRYATFRIDPAGAERWQAVRIADAPLSRVVVNSLIADPAQPVLWLATQSGFFSLATDEAGALPGPNFTPLLWQVTAGANRRIHAEEIGRGAPPTFEQRENSVRFDFAAPTFETDHRGQSRTLYRSRLDGLEPDWSSWSTEMHRAYTNLPGGRFTFRIQAQDIYGRVSDEARYRFGVHPAWWWSPWAFVGCVMAAGVGLSGIVRLRTRALHRRNAELEKIVAARTGELRRQNHELARLHRLELDEKITARLAAEKAQLDMLRYQLNPHFLFNALTSIRGQIPPALASARATVDRLADFCRLTLHGRKPGERATLAEEIATLRSYLEIEQTRLGEGLRVALDIDSAAESTLLPRLLLLPLIENALKYGHATSEGDTLELRIVARREAGGVWIEVSNTGRWVDAGARPDVASLGIGHDNIRDRLARHYPGAHEFGFRTSDGWVHVHLRLGRAAAQPALPA